MLDRRVFTALELSTFAVVHKIEIIPMLECANAVCFSYYEKNKQLTNVPVKQDIKGTLMDVGTN